jgi:hypothetical protein
MSMPETAIYKYASPIFLQHQVWMPWQSLMIQPIPKSFPPQPSPHNHLWLRILRMDCRHIFVSLLWAEFIHEPLLFDATKVANIIYTAKTFSFFYNVMPSS